jgi:sugar lactone lactonase YvrE
MIPEWFKKYRNKIPEFIVIDLGIKYSTINSSFCQENTMLKRFQIIGYATLAALSLTSQAAIAVPEKLWSLNGFDEPESVLAHPAKHVLYVSNINGSPVELNGKGYISLISDSGKILRHVWVNGMDAPKGMAIDSQYLYVADMQQLHIIDHDKGELVKSVKADSSVMLNDIAIDDKGNVYISDILGGGIYRYKDGILSQWINGKLLPHPNGLMFSYGKLIVATWGEGLKDDFSTDSLGSLFQLNTESGSLTPYQHVQHLGNLDGIATIGNSLYISDWMNGRVYELNNKKTSLLLNTGGHPADISSKGAQLFVPMMFSQRIDAYKIQP